MVTLSISNDSPDVPPCHFTSAQTFQKTDVEWDTSQTVSTFSRFSSPIQLPSAFSQSLSPKVQFWRHTFIVHNWSCISNPQGNLLANSSLVSVSGLKAPHWLGFQECCWVSKDLRAALIWVTENCRICSWKVNGLCIPLFFFTLAFGCGQQLSHLIEGTQSVDLIFVTVFFLCESHCSSEQFSNLRICA